MVNHLLEVYNVDEPLHGIKPRAAPVTDIRLLVIW